MNHILVTNDFPPKVGGIQSYLWELWRRLPPEDVTVLTTAYSGAADWDRRQPYRIERVATPVLLPGPRLARRVHDLADQTGARLVLLDPVSILAPLAPQLKVPYGVLVHGAEVVVGANTPGGQLLVRKALRDARLVIAAGSYPAEAARRAAGRPVPTLEVPPGVDPGRFRPLDEAERVAARERFGVDAGTPLVVSVSRLVPRKGMDTLIRAAAAMGERHPGLTVLIGGTGRDRKRLEGLIAESGAPVRIVGKVDHEELPAFYGMADVFAMLCRNRWAGIEQEGFGIVFLEAAAAGVPQVAGNSGGVRDAVVDGETGLIVDPSSDVDATVEALAMLLDDPALARRMAVSGRQRAEGELSHDAVAHRLRDGLSELEP